MTSPIRQVGVVPVWVNDQDAALEFFVVTLGFEKRADASYGPGMRWVEVAPPGGQTSLTLSKPHLPEHPLPGDGPFITFETDEIEDAVLLLTARGVEFESEIMVADPPVPPMVFFRDPDQNRFLLVERR